MTTTVNAQTDAPLSIGGRTFRSRLMVGTGKYADNPTMIDPAEADYLLPEERIFGVSINGDVRAYPARFLDWHEMFNDVVGGKPVSLSY